MSLTFCCSADADYDSSDYYKQPTELGGLSVIVPSGVKYMAPPVAPVSRNVDNPNYDRNWAKASGTFAPCPDDNPSYDTVRQAKVQNFRYPVSSQAASQMDVAVVPDEPVYECPADLGDDN